MNRPLLALFALSCLAFDCSSPPAPKPTPGTIDARAACARGVELKCTSLGPTPQGAECPVWLGASPVSSAYLKCVVDAADCETVSACR